jgi:hypothetical protein
LTYGKTTISIQQSTISNFRKHLMPNWLRVIDTVTGLARTAGRLRATFDPGTTDIADGATRGLETRLAGVVVAALKEAFDRDRARMDLERSQIEAEQRRAEEALAAELRRQAADRALGQLKLLAIIAIAAWMLSAALAVWLPGMREASLVPGGRCRLVRSVALLSHFRPSRAGALLPGTPRCRPAAPRPLPRGFSSSPWPALAPAFSPRYNMAICELVNWLN